MAFNVYNVVIFSNSMRAIATLKSKLHEKFRRKDMGKVSTVLGIMITRERIWYGVYYHFNAN